VVDARKDFHMSHKQGLGATLKDAVVVGLADEEAANKLLAALAIHCEAGGLSATVIGQTVVVTINDDEQFDAYEVKQILQGLLAD
jgi:hypothetical protein